MATTTSTSATTTATSNTADSTPENTPAGAGASRGVGPSTHNSMRSTWRKQDKSTWTIFHKLFEWLDMHQVSLDKKVPVHEKTDKVPHVPEWANQRWIIAHALIPLTIHQVWLWSGGAPWSGVFVWFFYHAGFQFGKVHEFQALRRLGHIYGHLDGDKHERDEVPDIAVAKVFHSLQLTAVLRSAMMAIFSYNRELGPVQMNWLWLPLEIGLYGIILDFWFYWYHRLMHDIGPLWKFHRTHHLTKHPNALLTLYADQVQEAFDIAGIPIMTWLTMRAMGMPMGFYEWFICGEYVTFAELAGHSGVRIHSQPPSTLGWLLKYFNCELIIEDHDLHHRKGWRSSYNYGKQTRLWDTIFGTLHPRLECTEETIDYVNTVPIPLWFERV